MSDYVDDYDEQDDNVAPEDEGMIPLNSEIHFIYCYACYRIHSVYFGSTFLDNSPDYVKDTTGRLIAKDVCNTCLEEIKNTSLEDNTLYNPQLIRDDVTEFKQKQERKSNTYIESFLKDSPKNKKMDFSKLFKKGR